MCMLPDLAALSDAEHLLRAAAHWTQVSIRMRSLTQYWAKAAGKGLDLRLGAKPDFFFFLRLLFTCYWEPGEEFVYSSC